MKKATHARTEPTVFASNVGLFTPVADGQPGKNIAVLFLSPWGMEEMCTRKYFRILAEQFSAIGIASLRFDLPGTANALDPTPENAGLHGWHDATRAAIQELRDLSGTQNIVLLGHGLGGSLAFRAASAAEDLAGLILMAPVIKGRSYLRELSLLSKFIDNTMGVKEELRDTAPGSIAGMRMPQEIAAELKELNLEKAPLPDPKVPILMVARSPETEANLTASLKQAGHVVEVIPYDGYDHAINSPLSQQIPAGLGDRLCAWLEKLPASQTTADGAARAPRVTPVVSDTFGETLVRFGTGHDFFGTLCEPAGPATGVAALILTTGYDPQSGWARSSVEMARRLAAVGVASLRFDSADTGDTAPVFGRRRQILYDPVQDEDVAVAHDYLRKHAIASKTMVIGRCSGAYVAFRATLSDPRWDACFVVNPPSFRWRFKGLPRTLSAYGDRLKNPDRVKSFVVGRLDARAVVQNIVVRLVDRTAAVAAKAFPPAMQLAHRSGGILDDFRTLARRGASVTVLYAEGDEGEADFRIHFGGNDEKLAEFPTVVLHRIPDADHNVTPRQARDRMFELIERQALSLAGTPN